MLHLGILLGAQSVFVFSPEMLVFPSWAQCKPTHMVLLHTGSERIVLRLLDSGGYLACGICWVCTVHLGLGTHNCPSIGYQ